MLLKGEVMIARDDNLAGMRQCCQPLIELKYGFKTYVLAAEVASVD
jgi:hypothetical protein